MGTVIVVFNQKGGVGKSTLTVNLVGAAVADGKRVKVIEADPAQSSTLSFYKMRMSKGIDCNNIDVMRIVTPTIHTEISKFKDYDYIIVDCGGRDSDITRSALIAAIKGIVIVPVKPANFDLWSSQKTLETIKKLRTESNREIKAAYVITMAPTNVKSKLLKNAQEVLKDLADEYQVTVFDEMTRLRQDYVESIGEGLTVAEHSKASKSAGEITALYDRIKQELGVN